MVSSIRDHPLPPDLVALGEVGLSGELRGVGQLEQRLREAAKLGFLRALVPRGPNTRSSPRVSDLEIIPVSTVRDALRAMTL